MFNYIIYHSGCLDGFSGFFIFAKTNKWIKGSTVHEDVPYANQVPPNIDGKNVIIIDVAYKPFIIKEIAERASKLLYIDHHKTNIEEIKNLNLKDPHEIVYDVNECGASLVWKYFYGKKKEPEFLKYIRDNDLGLWKLKETLDFISYLEVNFKTDPTLENIKEWSKLLKKSNLKQYINEGNIYNHYKNYLIKKTKYDIKLFPSKTLIKQYGLTNIYPGKYKVALVMFGCPNVSLVGNYIVDKVECDFCMIWKYNINSNKIIVSFRSKNEDVGEIAKLFGGGGHKLASACSFSNMPIFKLFEN